MGREKQRRERMGKGDTSMINDPVAGKYIQLALSLNWALDVMYKRRAKA